MTGTRRGFTLLELLATVALLVVLGTMLFQVFKQASDVVEISNARQEIFQYARAGLEFLSRELNGAFNGSDADDVITAGNGIRGMRVYHSAGNVMGPECTRREGSQSMFFTAGLLARDMDNTSAWFGKDVNCARVAYYLNDETGRLDKAAVYRTEVYNLTVREPAKGNPFIRNCLLFNIELISRFDQEWPVVNTKRQAQFQYMDWNSEDRNIPGVPYDDTTNPPTPKRRRGLPLALRLTLRITDERHALLYEWGPTPDPSDGANVRAWFIRGPDATRDYWGQEDPVVQTFQQVIYYGRRSD